MHSHAWGSAVVGMDASASCMGEHFRLSYTATSTTACDITHTAFSLRDQVPCPG